MHSEFGLGDRGNVNDADKVRSGKVEYLKKAVSKACGVLQKRLVDVSNEATKKELEIAIEGLMSTYETLPSEGLDKTPACLALWSSAAVTMRLIAKTLEQQGA